MDQHLPPIAFLGAGQMAEALIRGLLGAAIIQPAHIHASNRRHGRAQSLADQLGVHPAPSNLQAVQAAGIVFVSVKPQDVAALLDEVGADITAEHTVISIAAGVTLTTLQKRLPHHPAVIRVMPNAPTLVQSGMAVLALGSHVSPDQEAMALRIFNAVGRAVTLPEKHLDAATALSGSGPAFLAVIAEALSDAGVRVGLPRDVAHLLAAQTMLGTGRMLADTGMHPALLKEAVTSPGGTSIAGVHAMEHGGVRALLMDAVLAATARATELGNTFD